MTDSDNMLDIALDEDLVLIQGMWDAEHCESPHESPENRVCDHTVVATYGCSACNTYTKGCQSQLRYFLAQFGQGAVCRGCRHPIDNVWQVHA